MLTIKDLTLIKSAKTILKSLNLSLLPGRTTLILGKSGSGKTTLLRCISQLETHYTGAVLQNGRPLKTLTPKERALTIGFISQFYPLFPHLTVLGNCSLPLKIHDPLSKGEVEAKVRQILKWLDMERYIDARPSELSGGQQQRVAIARALMLDPSFLLFDEPTSALDPENTDLFVTLIQKLKSRGKGIVISTQDLTLATQLFERAYFIEEGRITESYDGEISSEPREKIAQFCRWQELVRL